MQIWIRRKNRAMILLPALLIIMTLTTGLVWGSLDGSNGLPATQKMLAEVNCMQDWTRMQDQNDAVKLAQIRRCDEALGIR